MEKADWVMDAVVRGKFTRQQAEYLYDMFMAELPEDDEEEED